MQFYVKDIMSTDIISVRESDSIKTLIKVFADNRILGVPVLDDHGYISGVVSSVDILKNEKSHTFYHAPTINLFEPTVYEDAKFYEQPVSSIMTKDLYTISPDDTIAKMAKIMYDKKIHRLLVVEYDKLIGIVSTFDLLKLLATSDEEVIV